MSSTLFFGSTNLSVEEGNSGTRLINFTVQRVGDLSAVASVDWGVVLSTTPGSASLSDFEGALLPSGTITFAAGETSRTIAIAIAGDTVIEGNERFTVALSSPVNAVFAGSPPIQPTATATILADDGAVLSLAAAGGQGYEGTAANGTVEFVVTRSGNTSVAASAAWAVSLPTAPFENASAADFPSGPLPSGVVSFAAGETSKVISVPVLADAVFEGNENFTLTLSAPSVGAVIANATANGRILNDEGVPFLSVTPPSQFLNIPEGNSGSTPITFTVTRTGDATAAVGANWSIFLPSSGAASAADFAGGVLPSGTVSFAAGEMTKTITVQIAGDTLVEPAEFFAIQLSAPTGGASIDGTVRTQGIQNDDGAIFSLASSNAGVADFNFTLGRFAEGNSGSSPASFVIMRDGDLSGTVSVDWSVVLSTSSSLMAGNASAADFAGGTIPTGTATFAPNERFKVISLALQGDTVAEGNEVFNISLSNPSAGGALAATTIATIGITDDDPFATISLAPPTAVSEGNSGSTTYTLTFLRSGNTAITSTANWTVSQIDFNLNGTDFAAGAFPSGTVTFAPGETTKQASFSIQGDTLVEGNETFFVSLNTPSAGTNLFSSSGTGTILNDDGATLSLGPALSLSEGNAGNTAFNFTVTRSGDTSIAASANWAVSVNSLMPFPPQASAADFAGGVLPSGLVSFAAGETSKTITVNVAGDTASESDETFTVTLSAPSSGAAIGTATTTGTIVNDDVPSGTVVQFASGGFSSINEGNGGVGGQAVFTVQRSGNLSGPSTMNWAVMGGLSGGATADDFAGGVLPSGTVSFAAGETSKTITINFAADGVIEPSESYSVLLSSPSVGTTIGTFTSQSGVIFNDDGAIISLLTGVASQVEGNTGSTAFTFTVTRSNDIGSAVSANWAVGTGAGSSAVSASDFVGGVLPSGSVSFAAGETSKTITVLIQGDTLVESTETLGITLFDPSAGAVLGTSSTSTTVIDDDGAVLNIAGGARTVTEGSSGPTPITFTITRGGNTAITAVANWAASLLSAGANDFFGGMPPSGSVTFLPGETSKDVTINIAGDTAVETNETFNFVISSSTVGSNLGTQGSVGVTIVNDDGAVIAFASPTLAFNEGNGTNTLASITVTRSGDTSIAASANWAVSSSGGASGSDFAGGVLPSGVVSFAAGETSRTITTELVGDLTEEAAELFTVTLSGPSLGAAIGLPGTTSVTITNDDLPIDGGPGADSLVGNIGDNQLRGFGGNDTLDGGAGNDTLDGGEGADQLTGGTGADTFRLTVDGNGRSTLANMDVVLDFTESQLDVLSFGGSNGTLSVAGQRRTFVFNGSTGIELTAAPTLGLALPAQAHNIPMYQAYWLQGVGAAAGRGWIVVDVDSDERVSAQDMVAEVRGVTSGAELNFPFLEFLSDAQRALGLTAPTGTAGNDSLVGSGRFESFLGTTGSDTLDGGLAASNTLSYGSFATPITVTLTGPGSGTVAKSAGALGTDSFRNFYSILGGSGGDRFDATGLMQAPFYSGSVQGNGGNDTFIGGFTPQDDGSVFANLVVAYGGANAAANIDLANGTASDGFGGTDTLTDVRRLSIFGTQNDSVLGTGFSDQVASAATGNRSIDLGAGTGDRWSMGTNSRDSITGAALSRVEVELGTGTSGGEFTGVARKYGFSGGAWTLVGTDTLRGVEQVNGSIGDDLIIGSDAANRFFGGEGNDTLNGGLGIDLVVFDSFTGASGLSERGVVVNLTTGTATDSWGFTDTLISIENAYGTQQSDDLTGVSVVGTRTFLRGLVGNDVLRAPALDTLVTADYRGDRAAVTVNLGTGLATDGWGDTDRLFSIQSVIGSRFGDVLTGGARNDLLEGFRGDDTLAGGAGTDVALFTGARADYTITRDSVTGALTVADNTAGRDGADLVAADIETLRFSDGDFATSAFTTSPTTFLAIAPTSADKAEGNAGTTPFTFTVTRSGNTAGTASVAWAVVAGTATEDDFPGGVLPAGSVSFAAGETSKVITVDVTGDTAGEPDQAFTVLLSGPIGAVITTASATGTIRSDDVVTINGTSGNDTITPGFVSANVSGGAPGSGNDVINGNAGNDSIDGGGGNDSIDGGEGANTLIGGEGNDTLNVSSGVMDSASGGAGNDVLMGRTTQLGQVVSVLNPGLGNDTIHGHSVWDNRVEYRFLDRVSLVERSEALVAVLGASGTATLGTEVDTLLNVTNIVGTNLSDRFTGSSAAEFFTPGLGNDTVDGGGGTDRIDYSDLAFGVTVNLATNQTTKGSQTDTLTSIEDVIGTAFADRLTGNSDGNVFRPLGGNDTVDGGTGYDSVRYTTGRDAFNGLLPGTMGGVVVNLTTGIATDNWGNTDTLLNIERVDGSDFNDDLAGKIITDPVAAGGRDTQLRGLAGNDTLRAPQNDARVNADYREDPGSVRVNLSGTDTVLGGITVLARTGRDGFGGTDSYDRIQGVLGSNSNDTILGSDRADRLNGWAGDDVLIGGAGDDVLGGGAGVDSYTGGAGYDQVLFGSYSSSEATPTQGVVASLLTLTIANDGYGNVESFAGGASDIEQLVGWNFNDDLTGARITWVGETGLPQRTFLTGANGADTLRAAAADAPFVAADHGSDADANSDGFGVTVNLLTQRAIDGWGNEDTLVNIGAARGSAARDSLIGNDGDNWFRGEGGNDTIAGGLGIDVVTYSNSGAAVVVDLAAGTAQDGFSATDSLSGIENVIGSSHNDTIRGDANANSFWGGGGDDLLEGRGGNDTLVGHGGNDVAVFSGPRGRYSITRDTVTGALTVSDTQSGGDGTDLVDASIETLRFNDVDVATSSIATPTLAISVLSASRAEGDSGSTAFTFAVIRTGDTTGVSSATWSVVAGTAGASDFTGGVLPSGTVSFAAGQGSQTITVNVAGDTAFEGDENFSVVLSAPVGATLGATSAFGLIQNDDVQVITGTIGNDTITPSLVTGGVTGGTPGAGPQLLQGLGGNDSLDGGAGHDSLEGGAGADQLLGGEGNDLLTGGAGNDTLIGGIGTDVAVFTGPRSRYAVWNEGGFLVVQDTLVDGDGVDRLDTGVETLRFSGGDVQVSSLTPTVLSIAALSADKVEGTGGTTAFTFTVTRTGDTAGVSTVLWYVNTLSGSNLADSSDFQGGFPSQTLTFAAGETSKTVTALVLADAANEPDEAFTAFLMSPTGASISTTNGLAAGLIRNDDTPPTVLSIAATSADKSEGNAGATTAFTFTVTRTGDTSGASSAAWSVGGANLNDFAGGVRPSGTVSFAAGETTQTITVNVAGDNTVEPDEAFTVTLATPTGATLGTSSATGTIRNDEFSTFSIAPLAASVAEGNAGNTAFTFTVSRTGNTALAASVNFAVTGTGGAAADAADFAGGVLPSGTVSFAAGETSRTLTINVAGDLVFEGNEGFTVTLSATSPNLLGTASATGTIVNDEPVTITGTPNPDTLNGTAANERLEGLASNDTLNGGGGDDTLVGGLGDDSLTGGAGLDRFTVDAGTDVIADLGLGGSEVVVVSSGATLNATVAAAWTAGSGTSNAGVASVLAQGFDVNLSAATGAQGWQVSNAGSTRAVTLTGSLRNDTLIGGERADALNGGAFNDSLVGNAGNDTLNGGAGNDTLTGGLGVDRFTVDAGRDVVTDLGAGGFDVLVVSAGAEARATLGGTWLASASTVNDGAASIETAGFTVNLASAAGIAGWTVTNATATGATATGSARADTLSGGSGNDVLLGREGADVLRGNAGDDALTGGAGNDTMTGALGVDRFFVDAGTDTVTDLGLGADALIVSAGAAVEATVAGNFRATALTSNAGVATVRAEGFTVDLTSATGASGWSVTNLGQARGVSLTGSANGDTLTGGDGADFLRGGGGADVLLGGASNDQLFGGAGNDTVTGGAGADRINVDAGVDVLTDLGAGGADTLIVSAGATVNATLAAAWTATAITSNAGVANITANGFGVSLASAVGPQGWSVSNAGSGVGVALTGSAQADTLAGGSGVDTLRGGLGADSFRFGSVAEANGDVIADFVAAQGDRIDLAGLDAHTGLGGDQAFVFVGSAGFSNTAGELRFAAGLLQGDVNGDGVADFGVALTGVASLNSANFWL